MFLVLSLGLMAATLVASEPPVYGSGSDEFDINSISSYLDADTSPSDSKSVGVGSGSYSYANYNQGAAPVSTALPYKSPTEPSYSSLTGSTAATSSHVGGFGSSSSSLAAGTNYFSQSSFPSSSPGQSSSSYSSPASPSYAAPASPSYAAPASSSYSAPSSSPYTQSSGQFESHVSFDGNGGSYSTGFKNDRPSGGFNFPSPDAHSSNQQEVNTHQSYHNYPPSSPGTSYKPQNSYGSPVQTNTFKEPANQFGSPGPQFPGSYGNAPFYDSKPFGSPSFGSDLSSGPEGPPTPWSGKPYTSEGPSPPYRTPYHSGPPPYFKDFASYKGPHADLPFSPNSHHGNFGPRPHSPYSGPSYGSRPSPYRSKYPGAGKSRYARHPRPYSGPRGYSGKPPSSRYPSYRTGVKTVYSPHQTRHY